MLARYAVSVKALLEREGKFLMIRGTREGEAEWSFPGGLVDRGEGLAEALRREVREETGLRVRVGRPFHAGKYEHPEGGENVVVFYRCEVTGGEPELGSEPDQQFLALEWVAPGGATDWARGVMEKATAGSSRPGR